MNVLRADPRVASCGEKGTSEITTDKKEGADRSTPSQEIQELGRLRASFSKFPILFVTDKAEL